MDDEKEKKIAEEVVWIIILVLVVVLFPVIYEYLTTNYGTPLGHAFAIVQTITIGALGWLVGLSLPISILLLIGIVSAVEGLKHIRKKEAELYDKKVEMAFDENVKGDPALTKKWQSVMTHADSPNASDWRQAIIEADIILGDILTKMGYQGASIGEQLQGANKADFNTLEQAWEGHKVRNQIAHEGSDFKLSQYEAKRVVNLYKQVFEEFFYV